MVQDRLDGPFNLGFSTDQRVHHALGCSLTQVTQALKTWSNGPLRSKDLKKEK